MVCLVNLKFGGISSQLRGGGGGESISVGWDFEFDQIMASFGMINKQFPTHKQSSANQSSDSFLDSLSFGFRSTLDLAQIVDSRIHKLRASLSLVHELA